MIEGLVRFLLCYHIVNKFEKDYYLCDISNSLAILYAFGYYTR